MRPCPLMGQDKEGALKPSEGYLRRITGHFEELRSLRNTETHIHTFQVVWCQSKERWLLWERLSSWPVKLRNGEFPTGQAGSSWENNGPDEAPNSEGPWEVEEKISEEGWGRETFYIRWWQLGDYQTELEISLPDNEQNKGPAPNCLPE